MKKAAHLHFGQPDSMHVLQQTLTADIPGVHASKEMLAILQKATHVLCTIPPSMLDTQVSWLWKVTCRLEMLFIIAGSFLASVMHICYMDIVLQHAFAT